MPNLTLYCKISLDIRHQEIIGCLNHRLWPSMGSLPFQWIGSQRHLHRMRAHWALPTLYQRSEKLERSISVPQHYTQGRMDCTMLVHYGRWRFAACKLLATYNMQVEYFGWYKIAIRTSQRVTPSKCSYLRKWSFFPLKVTFPHRRGSGCGLSLRKCHVCTSNLLVQWCHQLCNCTVYRRFDISH